ncbi:MAG: hypothetical protein H5T34_07585 [Candidatus Methanomethyliales bacterium]|nr:hypothetical protein [Candidatus Methanomethylicales archaeon]
MLRLDGNAIDRLALHEATLRIRHRGPEDEGYVLIDTSIGKLSVWVVMTKFTIIRELRAGLGKEGMVLSQSDTEVIVLGYEMIRKFAS